MTTALIYAMYASMALGAAALFLCLPRPGAAAKQWRIAGVILGIAALVGATSVMARWLSAFEGQSFFVVFAILVLVSAVRVVTHPKPVYSALYFIMVVMSVTGLCVLASAEFLGIALVIVYAGAILVTYVFVIMLAQQTGIAAYDRNAREPFAAVALGFLLAAATGQAMVSQQSLQAAGQDRAKVRLVAQSSGQQEAAALNSLANEKKVGNVQALGGALMTNYVVAVEVAGVLLLVAMVGAIAIAQKRIEPAALTPDEKRELASHDPDLKRAGREALPF